MHIIRLGEVGESVFYFEKAKLLDPDNKDILDQFTVCPEHVARRNRSPYPKAF